MVLFHFHTGHVVFSSITDMSKSEYDMCQISFDKVNHGYKGTNGIPGMRVGPSRRVLL